MLDGNSRENWSELARESYASYLEYTKDLTAKFDALCDEHKKGFLLEKFKEVFGTTNYDDVIKGLE